jgi:hypothetical protein
LPKGSDKEEDDDEEGQGKVDHNDAGHAADTGHDANANAMRMLEREGRADFYKSKDSLINDNFISLFGSQFKLLAVVPHRFLSCCLCNLFAVPPLPSLVAPPSLSCAASLSCWLVVASPPLLLRHHLSCAGWLLNCHLSSRIQIKQRHHGGPEGRCLVLPIRPLSTNLNGCGSPIIARERGRGENKQ